MKRNELKQKYHKETLCYYKDKNELINKEYMNWIEDKLIKQLTLTDVSSSVWMVQDTRTLVVYGLFTTRAKAIKYANGNNHIEINNLTLG